MDAKAILTIFGILGLCSVAMIIFYLRRMVRNRSMHVQQRRARFALFVFLVVLAGYALLVGVVGAPWEPSLGILGLYGFVGISGLIGHAERRQGKVIMDERDREIAVTATAAGFGSFWGVLCIGWTVLFLALGLDGVISVPIGRLGFILILGGTFIIHNIQALVVLILYWRDARGEAN